MTIEGWTLIPIDQSVVAHWVAVQEFDTAITAMTFEEWMKPFWGDDDE